MSRAELTTGDIMQVQCNSCRGEYHVSCRFGQERLWRITCPHCGSAMWVCAPVDERGKRTEPGTTRVVAES